MSERTLHDLIHLEVDAIHRGRGQAILSDGQWLPITHWLNADGDCEAENATACVCGPDFDGNWYAVNLSSFTGPVVQ